jgi:hypothetical protein
MARHTEAPKQPPAQTFEALALVRCPGGTFQVLTVLADESMVLSKTDPAMLAIAFDAFKVRATAMKERVLK